MSTANNWLPSQIIEQTSINEPTASTDDSVSQASPTTAEPSGLPKAITGQLATAPGGNYEVVYIGFKSSLNYPFVVENSLSSAQIFQYLPNTLNFPFDDESALDKVSVKKIIPFTASGISYTISVAEVYFPSDLVSKLDTYIQASDSKLYTNPSSTEHQLASLIDKRIPLTGLVTENTSSSTKSEGSSNNGSMDSRNSTVTNKGKIAGIAIGAAAGCGLYMSLMVLLFKKYKKNNGVELPSSDSESNIGLATNNSTIQSNGAGISGLFNRLGDSSSGEGVGSVPISEPVNASNSLGWAH